MKLRIALINRLILAFALGLPAAQATTTSSMAKVNLASLAPHGHYSRFIVSYRNGSAEESSPMLAMAHLHAAVARSSLGSLGANNASPLKLIYRRRLAIGADLVSTSHSLSTNAATTLMRHIAADPDVTYVEPDTPIHLLPVAHAPAVMLAQPSSFGKLGNTRVATTSLIPYPPKDPMFAKYQWNLTSPQDRGSPQGGIDVEKAWSAGADGHGIVVAVVDTGITRHPDLDTSLANDGYDFIIDHKISGRKVDGRVPGGWDTGDWSGVPTKRKDFYVSDWHGTQVAGIVAELANNGIGLAGVAPKARVLPVRVLGRGGDSSLSYVTDAIVWAAGGHVDGVPDNRHPAQVINLSLGIHGRCSPESGFGKATAYAIRHGVTVVVAVADSNDDSKNFTPDSCSGVIAVAANDVNGTRAPYSNYGRNVTLSAPGGSGNDRDDGFVWSTNNSGETGPERPTYNGMCGTSFAAPHVSGVVALILSAEKAAGKPLSTPAQIKTILTETARPFPVTPDKPIGAGILDAGAAVDRVLKQ